MTLEDQLAREDALSNWRLASLLTFNAFLIPSLEFNSGPLSQAKFLVPTIGLAISASFLGSMILGLRCKYGIHQKWEQANGSGSSPMGTTSGGSWYFANFLGPFLLSPVILTVFWFSMLMWSISA